MRVTVCELKDHKGDFSQDWDRLIQHTVKTESGCVLLPEMPFYPWFAWKKDFKKNVWNESVSAHNEWMPRLTELKTDYVMGSCPVNREGKRLNEGFIWDSTSGYRAAHTKSYLPDEEGYWEASWYDRGDGDFIPFQTGKFKVGYAICTEIWFFHHLRSYGNKGVHIVVCPRATPRSTLDKWLVAGRAASVVSGAFCLSSNRISRESNEVDLGGQGWIVGPDGEVLGVTSPNEPFVTVEIDLGEAEKAKFTYPRYVVDINE